MFAILFLGAVLAVFLTNGVVRGDAESGLLQPLVVRPLGRGTLLVARYFGAVAVTTVYVLVIYAVAVLVTRVTGGWTPSHVVVPGLALALAVAIVAAISLLLSVLMSATAQGIAVFMVFGAGLVGGLLGQIGDALDSSALSNDRRFRHHRVAVRSALSGGAAPDHDRHERVDQGRDPARAVRRCEGGGRRAGGVLARLRRRRPGGSRLGLRAPRPLGLVGGPRLACR